MQTNWLKNVKSCFDKEIVKMDLILRTYKVLSEIKKDLTDEFSGLGLVVYDSTIFSPANHCDLRPGIKFPRYNVYDENIYDCLLSISDYRNTLHDGFHFIDQEGTLTHVAQYFVPSIVKDLHPDQEHGVRLFSSICGSTILGVLFIATICSNGDIYIYESGKPLNLNNLLTEEKV